MPPRVLVIEPSGELRRCFSETLRRRGLLVAEAAGTEEAVMLCEDFSPDIIIADYNPTDHAASERMVALRRDHPGVTVLLTSDAFASEQTLGAITLLPKPAEPRALLAMLRRAVISDSLWLVRRGRAASEPA
jgi:CheY-like chemotaxis protein